MPVQSPEPYQHIARASPDPPALVQQEPRTLSICMFAAAPPHALEAVTNGVRVRVSSIFIPEHSRELPPRFFFAYRCSTVAAKRWPLFALCINLVGCLPCPMCVEGIQC